MKQFNQLIVALLFLVIVAGPGSLLAQAAKAAEAVKKEPAKVVPPDDTQGGLSEEGEKKLEAAMKAFHKEREDAVKKEKGKEPLKGYLKMSSTGLDKNRVIGINAIYGLYSENKIAKRTLTLILMDKIKDPFPRTSTNAFTKLRAVTGQKLDNNLSQWGKWWAEQEKREEDAKLTELTEKIAAEEGSAEKKEEKKEDKKVSSKGESKEEKKEEKKEETGEEADKPDPAAGKRELIGEHNASLGDLDRITLKNGREIECYIIREQKDVDGKIEVYIVKFKGAIGEVEYSADEVDGKPEYDINKDRTFMPLLVPVEKP